MRAGTWPAWYFFDRGACSGYVRQARASGPRGLLGNDDGDDDDDDDDDGDGGDDDDADDDDDDDGRRSSALWIRLRRPWAR